MPVIVNPKQNTKGYSEANVLKRDLVRAKRVTRLSECSMSKSSKQIKDLNEKVMKYIANQ